MDRDTERLCAWMALPGLIFFGVGLVPCLKFIPPLSPQLEADQIAAIYRDNAVGMRVGAAFILLGGGFLMPFVAAISAAMLRMGRQARVLAIAQLASGILNYVPLYLSGLIFAAAAFRTDRSPGEIQSLSDLGWLILVMPTPAFLVQGLVIALAVLRDTSPVPVFPRWVGYFNLWVALLSFPGLAISVFKTGPFAWDGVLAFWVPLGVLGPWAFIMLWLLVREGNRDISSSPTFPHPQPERLP